jgi:hypothetical protein
MKIFSAILFFTSLSFSQISNDQINVNVLGGSLTLSGSSAVTQSGSWTTGRTWTTASSTDSTSAVVTSMPAITGSVSITGTPTIANTAFGISGSLPSGTNAIGSITNTVFGSTQSGVWNVGLSTGSNVIGSISNTGFGITGTLPAFAATPTFNIGTGAFVDRTTAAAPYSNRLSDGTAFYDARSIRSLTFATDKVDASGSSLTANIGTTNGLALESGHAASTDTSTASINAKTPALGQSGMTGSSPVVIASNQTSIPVTGAFFQATQPVSAVSLPLPTGAATETTLASLNTSTTNGTQKTQIVNSGGSSISSLSDGNGGQALEVAVSATGFIASTANSTTAQLAAAATFAGTIETIFNQQVASILLTSDQNGTLTLRQYIDAGGTRKTNDWVYNIVAGVPFSRSFVVNGNYFNLVFTNTGGATTTTLNINTAYGTLAAATNLGNGPVSLDEVNGLPFITSVKGVQATNFLPVQQPKDTGRVSKMYSSVFTAATTEALVTLTPISDGTAGTTGTSFTVTSGKRLRIQQICLSTRNAGAAGQGVVIQLRMTSTGAVTATSNLVGTIATGSNLAIANSANSDCMVMPDGFELSGTQQFGVSQIGTATANNTVVVYGFEY